MAAADDGEMFVSDAVREALADGDVQLRDRGRHALKGVPGEWPLFAVDATGARARPPHALRVWVGWWR